MTNPEKSKKYCSCGFPQSSPRPHEHSNPEKSERERLAKELLGRFVGLPIHELDEYKDQALKIADFILSREARLKEALEFIANQKDKAGNWAVEIAKRTLDEISKAVK